MVREDRGGGVEEGSRVTCVEDNSVMRVVQSMPAQTATPNGTQASAHLKGECNYCIQYTYVKQSILGCLSYCGKTKKQTDQSNSPYLVTF